MKSINNKFIQSLGGLLVAMLALPVMASAAALIDIGIGTSYGWGGYNLTEVRADSSVESGSALQVGGASFHTEPLNAGTVKLKRGEEIRVNRADFQANTNLSASANQAVTADDKVTADERVEASERLEEYAREKLVADENIEELTFDFKTVSISYRSNSEIFGLISLSSVTRGIVHADGEVEVECAWYACSSSEEAELEEEIRGQVAPQMPSTGGAWSVDEQIESAETLHTGLRQGK